MSQVRTKARSEQRSYSRPSSLLTYLFTYLLTYLLTYLGPLGAKALLENGTYGSVACVSSPDGALVIEVEAAVAMSVLQGAHAPCPHVHMHARTGQPALKQVMHTCIHMYIRTCTCAQVSLLSSRSSPSTMAPPHAQVCICLCLCLYPCPCPHAHMPICPPRWRRLTRRCVLSRGLHTFRISHTYTRACAYVPHTFRVSRGLHTFRISRTYTRACAYVPHTFRVSHTYTRACAYVHTYTRTHAHTCTCACVHTYTCPLTRRLSRGTRLLP